MMKIMSSSISSSEPAERSWRAFIACFLAGAPAVLAIVLGGLAFLDPFDTGRLTLLDRPGIVYQRAQTASASRGRDQAFDSAIFGNSTIEALSARELSAATGLHFVSMVAEATGPKEQLALMDYFRRQHKAPRALVIGMDSTWCLDSMIDILPFPYWLYDSSNLAYLRGLFRVAVLDRVPGRVAVLTGRQEPANRDGDAALEFEASIRQQGLDEPALVHRKLFAIPRQTVPYNRTGRFAAAEPLKEMLASLPTTTAVVLVWAPVFINYQPAPNSPAEAMTESCHQVYAAIARDRPRTAEIDWGVDRPENHVEANFFDPIHYRGSLARAVEREIVASLKAMDGER